MDFMCLGFVLSCFKLTALKSKANQSKIVTEFTKFWSCQSFMTVVGIKVRDSSMSVGEFVSNCQNRLKHPSSSVSSFNCLPLKGDSDSLTHSYD